MSLIRVPQKAVKNINLREFKSRFTSTEYRTIRNATETNDKALQAWEIIACNGDVDLLDQMVKDNMQKFVTAGVLTQTRYDEIMV